MEIRVALKRLEEEVRILETWPVTKGKVLLYGSSFFANWGYERAQHHLSEMGGIGAVNHGFGGSTGEEQLYYYGRLVQPYAPKAIVLRGGLNDIFNGYTPAEARDLSTRVIQWAKSDFPGIKMVVLAIFDLPALAQKGCIDEIREYNRLMAEYAESTGDVACIDISEFFYQSPEDAGTFRNFKDIFLDDQLHLTNAGYEAVQEYFRQRVSGLV